MKPAGRLGDKSMCPDDSHGCKSCSHSVQGPAVTGSPDVFINGMPALRVGDKGIHAACCGENQWEATEGSATVFINGMPMHRMGDATAHCGGSGVLIEGSDNVLVGDSTAESVSLKAQKLQETEDEVMEPIAHGKLMNAETESEPQDLSEKDRYWKKYHFKDDETGEPLKGAYVTIEFENGSTQSKATDENGEVHFSLSDSSKCRVTRVHPLNEEFVFTKQG